MEKQSIWITSDYSCEGQKDGPWLTYGFSVTASKPSHQA